VNLAVGHVYIVHTTLSNPPKDKITICICASDNLFFWINTKPRPHGIGQMHLKAADHTALTHDCFLDCSRMTTFQPYEMEGAMHREPISRDLAQRIVRFLKDEPPRTLPPRYVNLAIANLSAI
jgi:hypothetical protein